MLRDLAVAEIQEGLKFRSDQADAIVRRLTRVQTLLEQGRTLPWFLVEEDKAISVLAGADVTLPTDFIREIEFGKGLYFLPTSTPTRPYFLQKMTLAEAQTVYADPTSATTPSARAYVLRGSRFQLFPPLDADTTFYFDYYKHAEALDANIENVWLANAPYLLIGNAGASFARTLDNKEALAEFQELAQTAWESMFKENILRELANRQLVLGRNS